MEFENELIPGVLIKRYKRFFVDIKLKNKIVTAHCPNPGSMIMLLNKGNRVWVSESNNDKRKLKFTLQVIESRNKKFCINTHITNKIILESLQKKLIDELSFYDLIKPEQKFGDSTRFDFLLTNKKENQKAFLEVKSVTLNRNGNHAEFPDAVTTRGKKHLEHLMLANRNGYKSYILFLIQLENCETFGIASDIDPDYSKIFKQAIKNNVNVLCYDCKFSNKGLKINKKIKIKHNE